MDNHFTIDASTINQFQSRLLAWYDSDARILPWRDNPTPYRVWISEIMLQQTRVDTVIPYFERFMGEVPTVAQLAEISDERLLKLWEGLGYYSRAMNLKKAARVLLETFGGEVPADLESLKRLPGIGPYSAGAIASIAFGIKAPAVDGNVLRVIARLTANAGELTDGKVRKDIGSLVEQLLPAERVGDFNQALMELGATVCLPNGQPKCEACPVCGLCEAARRGLAAELPVKTEKKGRTIEQKTVFVLQYGDSYAIRQRTEEGLLAGLWELPNADGRLDEAGCAAQLRSWGIEPASVSPIGAAKHIFTNREWHMTGYYVTVQQGTDHSGFVWTAKDALKKRYSIPTAFKAYMKFLLAN